MAEQHSIVVDGVKLSYLELGKAAEGRPSLLLLHGLIACAATYEPLMSRVGRHCIALDLPGHVDDERVSRVFGFEALAELVQGFARAIDMKDYVLVGHSHGGAVALRLAASAEEDLRGLVLICPAHPFSGREQILVRFYLSLVGRIFARSIPYWPKQLQLIAMNRVLGRKSPVDKKRFVLYRKRLREDGAIDETLGILESWRADMGALGSDLRARKLDVRTLLVWGADDPVVPAATVAALRECMRHSELIELPGIGHLPPEENREKCASVIRDWLRSLDAQDPNSHQHLLRGVNPAD